MLHDCCQIRPLRHHPVPWRKWENVFNLKRGEISGVIITRVQDEARHRALRQRGRHLFSVKMVQSVVCGELLTFPQGELGL